MRESITRFGAATLEPQQLQGSWRLRFQGKEYKDSLLRLIIEVEDTVENHEWFAEWKEKLKERFEQIDIRMTWHPNHVV